jgi:hypothetical protein
MVRVVVHSSHTSIADTVNEIETQSEFRLINTENINILETEILISRIRNIKKINHGT